MTSALPRRLIWIALCASALVHAGAAPRAHACSSTSCFDPVRTFGPNAAVPGNLVRFELSPNSHATNIQLELWTSDGVEVPLHDRAYEGPRVLEPVSPIAPGMMLELRYAYDCFEHVSAVYSFATTEHAALEAQPPALVLIGEGMSDLPSGYKRYRYELPVSDDAAHLADTTVTLDGQPIGAPEGGPALVDGVVTVHASCNDTLTNSSCTGQNTVTSGRHQVQLTTRIVGEAQQPAAFKQDIEVACDEGCAVTRPRASTRGRAAALFATLAFVLWARRRR